MTNEKLNKNYLEILKLDEMLSEAGIHHETHRIFDGWQVIYYGEKEKSGKWVMDAIEHSFSYGAKDDKLEIWGLLTKDEAEYDDVVGCLTAEDVFNRILKYEKELLKSKTK